MQSFALLAACLAAVQAWQVLLYADQNCVGTGYFTQNVDGCKQPDNMPADFDAKSVQLVDVSVNWLVTIFTDRNTQCQPPALDNTWVAYDGTGVDQCKK